MDMGKQLNLVHIQQSGAFVQFFNKIDGSVIAVIELSSKHGKYYIYF